MRAASLELFRSPEGGNLTLVDGVSDGTEIVGGRLVDDEGSSYEIRDGIPRFVPDGSYVESFGLQWNRYRAVQTEGSSLDPLTRRRYDEIGWPTDWLRGRRVLEAGCGAGRFTRLLLREGALVCSIDASTAVDACQQTVGLRDDHLLAQADILSAPFPKATFDTVFCFGVLQHTPDPALTFRHLAQFVKPGGELVVDVYRKRWTVDRWNSKYLWRPITSRMNPDRLRRIVEWYVPRWLPVDSKLAAVPLAGRFLVAVIPCWNYSNTIESADEGRAWAVLDTFDALSARYDKPQTVEKVRAWFTDVGFTDIAVRHGGNGILATGRKPVTSL